MQKTIERDLGRLGQWNLPSGHSKWAEPWEVLKSRILEGFEAIAKEVEENGGGNALVSHGWTIRTLVCLVEQMLNLPLSNGSVTRLRHMKMED